jgi:hypothetical protein
VRNAPVSRVVEEERVVGSRVPDEPGHCFEYILAQRLLAGTEASVVLEDDHILGLVAVLLHQKLGHVAVVFAP